jgi:hypothetical protein
VKNAKVQQMDDLTVAKARLNEPWSSHGWDHDTVMVKEWLKDIEDHYDGEIQRAIDKVHADLIEALELDPTAPEPDMENGPSELDFAPWTNRVEDIEFLTVELARLINMRNELMVTNK